MGRHADPTPHRRRPTRPVLISSGTAVVVVAGGLVWSLTGASSDARPCATQHTVAVTVAPELGDVATKLLAHPLPLASGGCAVAHVTASAPLQTVGDLAALDAGSLPAVWVPDSSLWAARAQGAKLTAVGSMASSPVVLATSKEAVDALGWTHTPPKWSAALTASHPVALPDLAGSATGLSALAAVRASLGGGAPADNAVVQAVLAAARSAAPNPADALASGAKGDASAPLVPVSEQQVFAADQGTADPKLTAVYPSDGSPSLDYPVLEVGSPSGAMRAAVDAVTRTLTSGAARAAVGKAGFRTGDGAAQADAGPATGIRSAAPKKLALDPKDVTALLARLSSLAAPSRILAVFDVSESMSGKVGTGTRATLSRDAASSALALFPDNSAIGLWVFARRMDGDKDYRQLLPTQTLNAQVGGQTQRAALRAALASIPNRLSPGGTGLYDTTLAAVKAAQADYDPKAVSSVVIVTDGHDEDAGGIGMPGLITGLAAIKNPARPVKVIGIALGPDADLGALKQIADATGGAAYAALDPKDLQTVLFDALRQRG
jgi:Ca-activated chloride channel family protein